jgi:hypothetical protein
MLLVPVFWVLLVFAAVEGMDDGLGVAELEDEPSCSMIPVSGKPIGIPPKKV